MKRETASGQAATGNYIRMPCSEIGDAENVSKSYVSRILRLALLAPDIIDAILAGTRAQSIMLDQLERSLPATWDEQRRLASTALM